MVDATVKLGRLVLKNPVIAASGTFGYGLEYSRYMDLNQLGGVVVKGLSLSPLPGNPPPRIIETTGGMLNAIGLQNIGVDAFIKEKLPSLRQYNVPIIVNVFGHTRDVAIDPEDQSILYIATSDHGIVKSENAGQSWKPIGRDLKHGGTWMGITRDGRFAAITNFREPFVQIANAPSRGFLVSDFLSSKESPKNTI